MSFTYIELFAGIGGFRLGLDSVGGVHLFANERDKSANATYAAWFGEENLNRRDIKELNLRADIPAHDVLTAGFPCQPFSIAGVAKKNSLGRRHGFQDKEQGNLFFYIRDVIRIHKPKIVFLENVRNLLSHDGGKTWQIILKTLNELGYTVKWKVISAENVLPQKRARIYIVALRNNYFSKEIIQDFEIPDIKGKKPKLGTILQKTTPNEKYMLSDKLWNYLQAYATKHREKGNGFGYKLYGRDEVAGTLSARYYKDGAEILIRERDWINPRRLTPKEAARLMGFSSKYALSRGFSNGFPIVVSDVQAYKQFGNAICPPIVELIASEIRKVLLIQSKLQKPKMTLRAKRAS